MADNIAIKDGSGSSVTLRSKDIGSGVQAPAHVPMDGSGNITPAGDAAARARHVNLNLAGTAIDGNSGNKSAGTVRVVIATDQPAMTAAQPVSPVAATAGGCSMHNLPASAATTNATSVKGSAGTVYGLQVFNTSGATKFLKLYDKASAPTVGSDTPVKTIPVPPTISSSLGGVVLAFPLGLAFPTGIAYAITGLVATNDTTAVAAGDVNLGIDYK